MTCVQRSLLSIRWEGCQALPLATCQCAPIKWCIMSSHTHGRLMPYLQCLTWYNCQSQAHLTTVADQCQRLALHQVCQLATHSHCARLLGILLCTQHPLLMCSTDCYTFQVCCIAAWWSQWYHNERQPGYLHNYAMIVCNIAQWWTLHCHMHDLVYHYAAALYKLLVYADGIPELWLMNLSILTTQPLIHAMVFNGAL